jgi:hypothetical protein
MNTERALYLLSIAALLFISGILYANEGSLKKTYTYSHTPDLNGGEYIRFVFIGSHSCPFSNNDTTHSMVLFLKEKFKNIAKDNTFNFISTGISVDMNSSYGFRYLQKTDHYDEIISGASVFNLGAIYYGNGVPSTPTIHLIYESYETELIGINMANLNNSKALINSYIGMHKIEELYNYVKSSKEQEIIDLLTSN